jgi:hypothetical protein
MFIPSGMSLAYCSVALQKTPFLLKPPKTGGDWVKTLNPLGCKAIPN